MRALDHWGAVLCAILLGWSAALIGFVSYFATPILVAFVAWLAVRRRFASIAVLSLTSPLLFASALATFGYVRGTALLRTVGESDPSLRNVDPTTRYQWTTSGCLVDGSEWVINEPNNATLYLLQALFGPMPGAYSGPYPSELEAQNALRSAPRASWKELVSGMLLGRRPIRLRQGLGEALASALSTRPPPVVALFQDRVLLLESEPTDGITEAEPLILLIDARSGKLIAYFGTPPLYPRKLPLPWTD
jgi:hypothetical protein